MRFLERLIINEDEARAAGLTHEGTLFGVPAWVAIDGEMVIGCPKFSPLRHYCDFGNWLLDVAASMAGDDVQFVTPHTLGRAL